MEHQRIETLVEIYKRTGSQGETIPRMALVAAHWADSRNVVDGKDMDVPARQDSQLEPTHLVNGG